METTTLIGIAIFAAVLLIATWQFGFAFGQDAGRERERRANALVSGVLAEVAKQRPTGRIPQRTRLKYRKVNPRSVGKKRYLNSRLAGEVLA
jgi:hypothetical protein